VHPAKVFFQQWLHQLLQKERKIFCNVLKRLFENEIANG